MRRHAKKIRQRMAIDLCDLANILDKIVLSKHWKYLFRTLRFQNFLGEKFQTPQVAHPIDAHVICLWLKNIPILHTQKVGQSDFISKEVVR